MKRLRSFLLFFILFLGFFYYYTSQNPHNHAGAKNHMNHSYVEIPQGYEVPDVNISVTQEQSGTWLLKVQPNHFTFAPEKVGQKEPSYNEGHAHLYVNGEKINRLYGQYYNLGSLKEGQNEIKVTLHSNNHGALVYKGKPIQNSTIVDVTS
ncbi:hypothetical protein J7I93_00045 [Bacillus sp. ISL-47]|uniref:hypothetical protein n=1 Tax=Bacillus sp. ISL-47 TaxID=2819130 RepID=UPI001BE710EA|nr:hypothetical protein [Bacillus sp. ISL-47]MBT2686565.1 hypothetical protein [Bacillus sp. ISL-47]MBT2706957.1 hypothetical protein [Pseudomonas sp. ISL-84]